jgi:L-lactate dehydrogenase complex protein LldG
MSNVPVSDVLANVRRALGRAEPLRTPPVPPKIDEPVARLVYSDLGMAELFEKRATAQKMLVGVLRVDDLLAEMAAFLRQTKSKRVMLSDTALLKRLEAGDYLDEHGFEARYWSGLTADESYDYDAGVTEVDFAVAETGSLVIRHRPEHGRLLSLVPFVHVAVVEPKHFVPDLIDLFERLAQEGCGSGVTMISGPSKTADIEMNTVTGVHGPNIVKAFVLQ